MDANGVNILQYAQNRPQALVQHHQSNTQHLAVVTERKSTVTNVFAWSKPLLSTPVSGNNQSGDCMRSLNVNCPPTAHKRAGKSSRMICYEDSDEESSYPNFSPNRVKSLRSTLVKTESCQMATMDIEMVDVCCNTKNLMSKTKQTHDVGSEPQAHTHSREYNSYLPYTLGCQNNSLKRTRGNLEEGMSSEVWFEQKPKRRKLFQAKNTQCSRKKKRKRNMSMLWYSHKQTKKRKVLIKPLCSV
mmetsp:Transcript_9130/g.10142  ORF Transcript_9130/g.10142 Transcript_9130/m.10142 type:complete len:244 (+) Transcript_9130:17-748(+)